MATEAQTAHNKKAFLEAFERTGIVLAACDESGVSRRSVYSWRDADPDFAAAWAQAEERSTQRLEREAIRRAAEGVEEPVFQGGVEVGRIRKYSDTLLIFLLKARRPAVYRERVEQIHKTEGAVNDQLSAAEREQIRRALVETPGR